MSQGQKRWQYWKEWLMSAHHLVSKSSLWNSKVQQRVCPCLPSNRAAQSLSWVWEQRLQPPYTGAWLFVGVAGRARGRGKTDSMIFANRTSHSTIFFVALLHVTWSKIYFTPLAAWTLMESLTYCKQQALNLLSGIRKEKREGPTIYSF